MKNLGESLKYLPNNLQHLILNLFSNNLAENTDNLKFLGKTIKYLP